MLVEFVVAAGKKEQGRSWARIDNSARVDGGEGPAPESADIVFTATPADAQAMHDGSLQLAVGFMRGQVKMAGDFGALLHFLPVTQGDGAAVRVAELLP